MFLRDLWLAATAAGQLVPEACALLEGLWAVRLFHGPGKDLPSGPRGLDALEWEADGLDGFAEGCFPLFMESKKTRFWQNKGGIGLSQVFASKDKACGILIWHYLTTGFDIVLYCFDHFSGLPRSQAFYEPPEKGAQGCYQPQNQREACSWPRQCSEKAVRKEHRVGGCLQKMCGLHSRKSWEGCLGLIFLSLSKKDLSAGRSLDWLSLIELFCFSLGSY